MYCEAGRCICREKRPTVLHSPRDVNGSIWGFERNWPLALIHRTRPAIKIWCRLTPSWTAPPWSSSEPAPRRTAIACPHATPTCFAALLRQACEANPLRDEACGSEKAQRHRCVRQRCARRGRPSDFRRLCERSATGALQVVEQPLARLAFLGGTCLG